MTAAEWWRALYPPNLTDEELVVARRERRLRVARAWYHRRQQAGQPTRATVDRERVQEANRLRRERYGADHEHCRDALREAGAPLPLPPAELVTFPRVGWELLVPVRHWDAPRAVALIHAVAEWHRRRHQWAAALKLTDDETARALSRRRSA